MANDNFEIDSSMIPSDFGIMSTEILNGDQMADFILGDSETINTIEEIENKNTRTSTKETEEELTETQKRIELEKEAQALLEEELEADEKVTPATKKIEKEEETEEINTFEVLSKNLFDLGIFNKTEDEEEDVKISTPEEFRDRFLKEVNVQANSQIYNFISDKHGEEGLEMFESVFMKGVPPEEYLNRYTKIESLKDLDLTQESVQEQVYRVYYKKLGWDGDKIDKKISKLKDYGELEEEAIIVHEKLIEQEQKEFAGLEAKKVQEEQVKLQEKQRYANTINQIISEKLKTKDFDGIPLTEKVAKEAYENLVVEKYKLQSGEKLTEFDKAILELRKPENYEKKVKLWLLLQNDLDLTKIKTKAISDKSEKLFDGLTVKDRVTKRTGPLGNDNFSKLL